MVESWIEAYGYAVVFAGTFLEGETVLVLAGLAAHRGYLTLGGVWLCAFWGSLLGDQLYFALGRWRGAGWLHRRPTWSTHVARARSLIERRGNLALVGFRFVYGIRIVTPFVLGASGFRPRRFLVLNALGAALWAGTIGGAGWAFGEAASVLLGNLERYEAALFGLVVMGALLLALRHRRMLREVLRETPAAPPEPPSPSGMDHTN